MKNKIFLILIILLAAGLRFYKIISLPALNADEAALGYNAYSLLETGKDEHGESWPLVFKSFGDYKPGVYVYLAMPFVKVLGLNVLAVRLPGLILSVLAVWLVYLVVKELRHLDSQKSLILNQAQDDALALISSLMLAISPWHIHFSRGAWETQVSTSLLLLGIYGFLKGLKNEKWFLVWVLSFVLSIYTYHSMRVVVPLLGLGMVGIWWKEIKQIFKFQISPVQKNVRGTANNKQNNKVENLKFKNINQYWFSGSILLGLVLMLPLGASLLGESGLSRAQGVSIFADTGPVWRVNEARGMHENYNDWWVKIIHNKPVVYGLRFFENYFRHYSIDFLFIEGDEIQRNKVPGFGQLYLVSLPLVLMGLWVLMSNVKGQMSKVILYWLVIAPIPAALTFQSPHALRAFNMVVPWMVVTAAGLGWTVRSLGGGGRLGKVITGLFVLMFIWDLGRYLFNYYRLLVPTYPYSSQYGFNELVPYLESVKDRYEKIHVTDRYDQPYILFLFFSKYSPDRFQNEVILSPRDEYGFSTVRDFDKYHFEEIDDFNRVKLGCGNCLIVGTEEEIGSDEEIIKEFRLLDKGKVLFRVAK